MNFIIWLIVGGLVGWVASMVMGTNRQQGILMNIIVGIVGAFLAGIVLTPYFGISTINQNNFSLPALLVSLVGAIILLAVVSLFTRRGGFRLR
ncbi:MAG TPA: GlsB/YeaQ/YmgE family stress response membrane protein [Anaerolineae bacterium]